MGAGTTGRAVGRLAGLVAAGACVFFSCVEKGAVAPPEDAARPSVSARASGADVAGEARSAAAPAPAAARARFDDYVVSGPYAHENLAVYLIHGRDRLADRDFLTLEEALDAKLVVVHETGEVNELAVENLLPDREVYIQSGDIVKGGRQDRVIASDFIVPAKSGKMPISSFCVERGRWSRRGGESATAFSVSREQLATKALKLAAKLEGDQSAVWREVASAQTSLAANLGSAGGTAAAAAAPAHDEEPQQVVIVTPDGADLGRQVAVQISGGAWGVNAARSGASPTSLQLTLEKADVKEAAEKYVAALAGIVEGKPDVIGFAFAVNGEPNSADVYASGALFRKLWPKLLKASAVEALAELRRSEAAEREDEIAHPPADALVAALLEMEEGAKASEKDVTRRVRMRTVEGARAVLFETRDAACPDEVIHRSMLSK